MSWKDRGVRGLETSKPLVLKRGSFIDPTSAGPFMFVDFLVNDMAEDASTLINQSGTPTTAAALSATAGAPTAGHGGWLAGASDDVDAELDEVALGALPWLSVARAGRGVLIGEIGFVIPTALTTRQYFFGLTDDETEGTGTNGSLNIAADVTLTSVATDAAGFIFSSLATDVDGYYTASVNADTDGTVTNSGMTGIVDDYTKLRVEIDIDGDAYFYGAVSPSSSRSNITPVHVASNALAVATTALLIPLFAAAPTTTTAVPWEIDYMFGAASEG